MKYLFCLAMIAFLSACDNAALQSGGSGGNVSASAAASEGSVEKFELLGVDLRKEKIERLKSAIADAGGKVLMQRDGLVRYDAEKILENNGYIEVLFLPDGSIAQVAYSLTGSIFVDAVTKMQDTIDALSMKYGAPSYRSHDKLDVNDFTANWERGGDSYLKLRWSDISEDKTYPMLFYVNTNSLRAWNKWDDERSDALKEREDAKMGSKL